MNQNIHKKKAGEQEYQKGRTKKWNAISMDLRMWKTSNGMRKVNEILDCKITQKSTKVTRNSLEPQR